MKTAAKRAFSDNGENSVQIAAGDPDLQGVRQAGNLGNDAGAARCVTDEPSLAGEMPCCCGEDGPARLYIVQDVATLIPKGGKGMIARPYFRNKNVSENINAERTGIR